MGDQLEVRINAIESIQEEFGHDIPKIKEQLARLTKLVEDCAKAKVVQPRNSSPPNLRPCFRLRTMFQIGLITLICVFRCMLQ